MCIIIDANVVTRVLVRDGDRSLGRLRDALMGKTTIPVKMVYGGELRREYEKLGKVRKAVLLLDRAGRARLVPDPPVDEEERRVRRQGLCRSNDAHVIALARVSGARVLCSEDRDLQRDFKEKGLLDNPRGRVYTRSSHHHLLREACQGE